MTFTADLWARIAPIRAAIEELPFVEALADGSLERGLFVGYLAQDAHYLGDYARALAAAAAQSARGDELAFWAGAARDAVLVERALHESHLVGVEPVVASPTCAAYTGHLLSLTTAGHLPSLAAGLLPCFWIYADVGETLLARAGSLEGHPYADWIATYADPDFAASTAAARAIVDRLASAGSPADRARMESAFVRASQYEWMFWDAAWREETWPVTALP